MLLDPVTVSVAILPGSVVLHSGRPQIATCIELVGDV